MAIPESVKIFKSQYLSQNTTLFQQNGAAVLVDPGVYPSEMQVIQEWIANRGLQLTAILFTHLHGDHFAGWQYFDGVDLFAGTSARHKSATQKQKDLHYVQNLFRSNNIEEYGEVEYPYPLNFIGNNETVELAGMTFRFLQSPGHSADMNMIVCEDFSALCSGDMLIRSPYPFILQSIFQYRLSLGYIKRQVEALNIDLCIPGHYQEAHGLGVMERIIGEEKYIDDLYRFVIDHFEPDTDLKKLERDVLHMYPRRKEVHFTHKMNVHHMIREIQGLIRH
jgi:hydroxyacylglutathione hydrolase